MDLKDNFHVIQERIIKTDEVIRLLDVKKKEANKLDKNYKKLIEKFCAKHTEVVNLKNECQKLNSNLTNSPESHLLCQKEINELKTQNELLEQNYNEYVNAAVTKYQSACQEIETLNKKCDSLNKKIEKIEFKGSKIKNVKKLQDSLNEAKEQLKETIFKYDDLENTSNKTISDLKKECKILEERRNEALKQLSKARLDSDELRKSIETTKNSPTKSKLQQKIELLETKLQSCEIEQDFLNQSHETDITELKKEHEKEKKLFETQLKELRKKISEETHIIKEKQDHQNYVTELTIKHENEKKLMKDQLSQLENKINKEVKNHENDKKCLNDQLQVLKNKISEETNKIKETTGTQTDYEDIYNLEDILTEMHSLPAVMSPLISECSSKQDAEESSLPETCSIAVGTDDVLPNFTDSSSQTGEGKIKARSFNLRTEVFNIVDISVEKFNCSVATDTDDFITLTNSSTQTNDDIFPVAANEICETLSLNLNETNGQTMNLPEKRIQITEIPVEKIPSVEIETIAQVTENNDEIYVHLIPIKSSTCSTAVGSDDVLPAFTETGSQTCDFVNENLSKIKVRSFDLCTEVFNETPVENSTETDDCILITDTTTQTSNENKTDDCILVSDLTTQSSNASNNHENKIEFKSSDASIITLPKTNIFEEIPKNVKLKSRVTKKYKNNNKNRLLNTLRNSKLNLKCLLEKYMKTSSKLVIVSSSILKSDNSKIKIPDTFEQKVEGCSNSYYSNCPHTVRHENYCSCSCQQNMLYNRYFGQCPGYQMPCNYNHDTYYKPNSRDYYDMKQQFKPRHKHFDEIFSSSDSDEEDNKVLKEYKYSVIKKYITNKYLAKIAKKNENLPSDNFENNLNNKDKNKAKLSRKKKLYKSSKSKRIIFSSDSEDETTEVSYHHRKKTNTISNSTKSNTINNTKDNREKSNNCTSNKVIDKSINNIITEEKEENETVANHTEIKSSSSNPNLNEVTNIERPIDEIKDFSENISVIPDESENNLNRPTEENNKIAETVSKIPEANNTNIKITEIIRKRLQKRSTVEETNISRTSEENIHSKTVNEKHAVNQSKLPFILSKKQQVLLRKGKSLKNGGNIIKSTNSKELLSQPKTYSKLSNINCNPLKRKLSLSNDVEVYKKQKQELFGLDSDSDVSSIHECETSEKTVDSIHSADSNCSEQNTTSVSIPERTKSPGKSLMSDNKSNTEKIPAIPTEYTSKLRTKTRIVLQKPETCTVNAVTNMVVDIPEVVTKTNCINLSNAKTNSPVPKKVFKRPGIYKINSPPLKKNKTKKTCEIRRTDINKDSPDSSDAESNEFVIYNKLERPSTSVVIKENKSLRIEKRIDIDLAKKLIMDVATMDWDKQLMATVVSYLADKNSMTVARLIVNEAEKDFSQEFDKSFTPPAPLLTHTQQKIMVLLSHLEKNNLPNIHTIFLQTVETRLLLATRVEVVHPLTRLYVAACKIKYEIEKVRTLCCNAAFYMGDLLLPLMFIVLTMWGDILPMASNSDDIPLAIAIVRVIHLKTCRSPGYNFANLHRLLSDYYEYKKDVSDEEIIKQLIRSYSDNHSKTAFTAIVILCKNLPHKATYNFIKNHLLPLLENCNNSDNKFMTISLIQRIISQFQMMDRDCIIDIKNCLSKYVINPGVVPSI